MFINVINGWIMSCVIANICLIAVYDMASKNNARFGLAEASNLAFNRFLQL